MKILITNTVTLNTGDAAILMGLLKILNATFKEEIKLTVYDREPDVASKYYPELTFRGWLYLALTQAYVTKFMGNIFMFFSLSRFYLAAWCWQQKLHFITKSLLTKEEMQDLLEYTSADLIVSTGGTYLVENYPLKARIFDYRISLLLGKPLIFFTQSLGPFSVAAHRKIFKNIFEKSLLILLRDRSSENHILDLGVNNVNTHITADVAFALADPSAIKAAKDVKDFSSPLKIAISVRDWKFFKTVALDIGRDNYLKSIGAVTEHLVKSYRAEVTFISTCQGIPEYRADDSEVALEITKNLAATVADSVNVDRNFHSPQELADIIRSFDLVISTRLHMAILALGVGIPVLPIAYEFKTQDVFNNLGQGHVVLDIEDINGQLLITSIDSYIASINEIRPTLFSAVQREYERAWKTPILVKKAFDIKTD